MAASAAFWIAGERLCATGQPTTPRRVTSPRSRPLRAARERLTVASAARLLVLRRIGKELFVVRFERTRAVAAHPGHEVEEVCLRGMRRGLDRSEARIVDRSRRKALVVARVVQRGRVPLRLG